MAKLATLVKYACAIVLFAAAQAGARADRLDTVPEPFRESAQQKTVEIDFPYWNYILGATVFDAGRSDRRSHRLTFSWEKSRAKWGNRSKTALEGNRVYFQAYDDKQNFDALVQVRERMEQLPSQYPMASWTRNQQLAYWLNLYNVTMMEQLVRIYPVKQLDDVLYDEDSLLDRKILNVAGISLSLNDIHHRILIPKWRDPMIMYGLFHGYVGSGNLRQEAYTDENVHELLQDNGEEFVNSLRGAVVDGDVLHVAALYERNARLFPDFYPDLRAHIISLLDPAYAALAENINTIDADTSDYYIADLSLGVTIDRKMGQILTLEIEGYERTVGRGPHVPGHVIAYAAEIQKKKAKQKPNVTVEEFTEEEKETADGGK